MQPLGDFFPNPLHMVLPFFVCVSLHLFFRFRLFPGSLIFPAYPSPEAVKLTVTFNWVFSQLSEAIPKSGEARGSAIPWFGPFLQPERRAMKTRGPENFNRRQILAFDSENPAGPGMTRVPGNLKMRAFEAVWGAGRTGV
jgi:hypothetical protein